MYKENILDCIGNTPLVKLNKIIKKYNLSFNLFAKVERFNPSGSIKDRASYFMIKDALNNHKINNDTLIIEPTSGNTGIGLAMICAYLNLKCHIYMPANSSIERVKMMEAYGAKVILTEASLGMKGAIEAAFKEYKENKNSFVPSQFDNLANLKSHYYTTAKEILYDLDNKIDVLIAGIGTGGTISGISSYFKDNNINAYIIGVEPNASPLLTKKYTGAHKIQGIGANFVPKILKLENINEVIDIKDDEAYKGCNILAKEEGIFAGISSGAALSAALKLDSNKFKNKNIVIILPDNGERYLSVEGLYE